MGEINDLLSAWESMGVRSWAEQDTYGWIMENGKAIKFAPWQAAVTSAFFPLGNPATDALPSPLYYLCSTIKKVGKSTLCNIFLTFRWLTIPGLHIYIANDLQQGDELGITVITDMLKRHPILRDYVKIRRNELTFQPTGSRIIALPNDFAGAAGMTHQTVLSSECWAAEYESAKRLFDQLIPIPGGQSIFILDSFAGYTDSPQDSVLLQTWTRAMEGEQIADEYPIYRNGGLIAYVHQGEDARQKCWLGTDVEREAYMAEMRASLRQQAWKQFFENQWSSKEDTFITPELWDDLIDDSYTLPNHDRGIRLYAAMDLATKFDTSAIVSVYHGADADGQEVLYLGPWLVQKPPADFSDLESFVMNLSRNFSIAALAFDPWQAASMVERLRRRGVPCIEVPQSIQRMSEAANSLYEAVKEQRLVIPPGQAVLRDHVLSAQARASSRGFRLVKASKGGRKIDLAIALAMAVDLAVGVPQGDLFRVLDVGDDEAVVVDAPRYSARWGEG